MTEININNFCKKTIKKNWEILQESTKLLLRQVSLFCIENQIGDVALAKKILNISDTTQKVTVSDNIGLQNLLGNKFLASDGTTHTNIDSIVGDSELIGIYWSAHWCVPCRQFTPKLVTFIEMLGEENINFPVIFASGDKDKSSFAKYFGSFAGPQWSAFPQGDKRITALKKKFGVNGIPWLVILDKQGNLVCNNAENTIHRGTPIFQKWLSQVKSTE